MTGLKPMISSVGIQDVSFRPAAMSDARDLLDIKNDPDTRRFSIVTKSEISWEAHLLWLKDKLADFEGTRLICVCVEGRVVGDVRLDIGPYIEVSIRLKPEFRHRGLGAIALRHITELAQAIRAGREILAKIVEGNAASLALFNKIGYAEFKYSDGVHYLRYAN